MSAVNKIKNTPFVSTLVIISLLFVGLGLFNVRPKEVSVAESTDCFGAYANMYGSDSASGVIKGLATVNIALSTSTQTPSKVIVLLDGQEVGQARPEASANYSWLMKIPTKLLDPKDYELRALIRFSGYECVTPAFITQPVDPGGQSEFVLTPNKTKLEIPVNNSALVSASLNVPGYNDNFAQFALFDWFAESRGSITPTQNRQTSFYSGPSTGNGKIKAVARFGFRAADTRIDTLITDPNSPISDDLANNASSTDTTSSSSATTTTAVSPLDEDVVSTETPSSGPIEITASIGSDDATKECAIAALGKERFDKINNGEARPNPEELIKLKACFARTNYILPSNFAPVAPGDVSKLQLTTAAKIEKLENVVKEKNGEQKQAIRFSGKAKPNKAVVIYIFSEPMVLTTTANENGEWIYELENPLEPGDHTMYAVVDRGDGVYERTDPINFAIGSAEATADNPAGLSLALNEQVSASDSSLSTYLYIVSSAVLLSAVVLVAVVAYRHGKHAKIDSAEPSFTDPEANLASPSTEQTFSSVQTVQPTNNNLNDLNQQPATSVAGEQQVQNQKPQDEKQV